MKRKIKKVTPAMLWQRKRWTTKGQVCASKKIIEDLLLSDSVLTTKEKIVIRQVIGRLSTLAKNWWKDKDADRDSWCADWRHKNW